MVTQREIQMLGELLEAKATNIAKAAAAQVLAESRIEREQDIADHAASCPGPRWAAALAKITWVLVAAIIVALVTYTVKAITG